MNTRNKLISIKEQLKNSTIFEDNFQNLKLKNKISRIKMISLFTRNKF